MDELSGAIACVAFGWGERVAPALKIVWVEVVVWYLRVTDSSVELALGEPPVPEALG